MWLDKLPPSILQILGTLPEEATIHKHADTIDRIPTGYTQIINIQDNQAKKEDIYWLDIKLAKMRQQMQSLILHT